jgi:hypothetical protein
MAPVSKERKEDGVSLPVIVRVAAAASSLFLMKKWLRPRFAVLGWGGRS